MNDDEFQKINLLDKQELLLPICSNNKIKLSETDIHQLQNGNLYDNYYKMMYKILKRYGFQLEKEKWFKNRKIFEYTK